MERINKDLVPMKAHYFLFGAATGPLMQFMPLIGNQLGFSASMIGIVYTILPMTGLIVKPLFCGMADKFGLHKAIFVLFQAVFCIGFLIVHFIPAVEPMSKVTVNCNQKASFLLFPVAADSGDEKFALQQNYPSNSFSKCKLSCNGITESYKKSCNNLTTLSFCALEPGKVFNADVSLKMNKLVNEKSARIDIPIDKAAIVNQSQEHLVCGSLLDVSCRATCSEDKLLQRLLWNAEVKQNDIITPASDYRYHWFIAAAVMSWVGMAVVVSISDSICFAILGSDKHKNYGKQRMWGSIGTGIFGISGGYLIDVFSSNEYRKDFSCIFYILVIAVVFDIVVSAILRTTDITPKNSEPSILNEMGTLCKDPAILAFAFWCVGAGMCTGVVWNFVFLYAYDLATKPQLEHIQTLLGLMTGIQNFLGELPFNFIAGGILKKFGHINVMSLVLLVYAMRFMAYSLITEVWLIILVEFLHGPSLGLCWPAMVSYGEKVAPPGTKATIQGLVGAIFEGIGVALGSLVCGYLMEGVGGANTFRIFSGGALAWLAIYWITQVILRKAKSFPIHQGHNHLASYAPRDDALLMTMSQEMQTY